MVNKQFDERGILTTDDIDFLKGEKELDGSPKSNAKQRIRKRVAAAMFDFMVLLEHWPVEQQRKTIDLIEEDSEKSVGELSSEMVAFLYSFLNSTNTDPELVTEEDPTTNLLRFRIAVCEGIRKGKEEFEKSPGKVCIGSTTSLYETPDPELVRSNVSSAILTDAHRKMENMYREFVQHEDEERVVDTRDDAIDELYSRWEQMMDNRISGRRKRANPFIRPSGGLDHNHYMYMDEYKKQEELLNK